MSAKLLNTDINRKRVFVAICMAAMFQMSNLVVSTIMSKVGDVFPGVSDLAVQLLMTLPDLAIIAATFLVGRITSRISPKAIMLTGMSFVALGGGCGLLMHGSMAILYVWAVLMGIGRGLYITALSILMSSCLNETDRTKAFGYQTFFISMGGAIILVLSGVAANISWYACNAVYLLIIPAIIATAICMPGGRTPAKEKSPDKTQRARFHPSIYIISALAFCFLLIYNLFPANCAMLLAEYGVERTALWTGIINGAFMVGGAITGLMFEKLSNRLHNGTMVLAFALLTLGLILPITVKNVPGVLIGALLTGASVSNFTPQANVFISLKAHPTTLAASMSLFYCIIYLGGFFSSMLITPLAALFSDLVSTRILIALILAAVFTLVSLILTRTKIMKD